MTHSYPFDPTYGYKLDDLLSVPAPPEPDDYVPFWQERRAATDKIDPAPRIMPTGRQIGTWNAFDFYCQSTHEAMIGGWLLVPAKGAVKRAFVVSHGYAGRSAPDANLPFADAALLFPCARGLSRSAQRGLPNNSYEHVVYDIEYPERYLLGQCVEDIWQSVSALLSLFPSVEGKIGYMGTSFGGGLGMMAMAFDPRINRAHISVPSFGNQALRLTFPTQGSAMSVQKFLRKNETTILKTLSYHDAAIAARHVTAPTHCACALFDPSVAPPGQFAIYNSLKAEKQLFILDAGHHDYPERQQQELELNAELTDFFAPLSQRK